MSTDPFKCSCFVSLNIVIALYAGMLSRLCFWRISVKALQAKLLRLELRTRVFISGCLRGSLEKVHSFSNLNAPWRPTLVPSLRIGIFFSRHFFKASSTIAEWDFKGINLVTSLPEVLTCKLFDADRNYYFHTQPGVAHRWLILLAWTE